MDTLLGQAWWHGISVIVLTATLGALIWYAWETRKIALLQKEEIGLKKRPVVSIGCNNKATHQKLLDDRKLRFFPVMTNFSSVHAKARISAFVYVDGKHLIITPERWHYSGKRAWNLQANHNIQGSINLFELAEMNDVDLHQPAGKKVCIYFKMWVTNFDDAEEGLITDSQLNPICQWDLTWKEDKPIWIPEFAPDGIDGSDGSNLG